MTDGMRMHWILKSTTILTAFVLGLALAHCGDDDDANTGGDTSEDTTAGGGETAGEDDTTTTGDGGEGTDSAGDDDDDDAGNTGDPGDDDDDDDTAGTAGTDTSAATGTDTDDGTTDGESDGFSETGIIGETGETTDGSADTTAPSDETTGSDTTGSDTTGGPSGCGAGQTPNACNGDFDGTINRTAPDQSIPAAGLNPKVDIKNIQTGFKLTTTTSSCQAQMELTISVDLTIATPIVPTQCATKVLVNDTATWNGNEFVGEQVRATFCCGGNVSVTSVTINDDDVTPGCGNSITDGIVKAQIKQQLGTLFTQIKECPAP